MTTAELIEILEQFNPDAEVRFASQPSWPFEYSIENVVSEGEGEDEIVYLAEGEQIGYLPEEVKEELGW